MIEAIFSRTSREAAIDGAYQYDTGQRLRLSGLPSPDELMGTDELLSGDLVAVQAQYSFVGDSQTEPRLAQWDEDRWAWVADIPDEYLTRHEAVHVYVYVSYGEDAGGGRNKTCYEGVFTPISRPAPAGTVTEDQLEQWAALEQEIELALVDAQSAEENASAQIDTTNAAAQAAQEAAQTASDAAKAAQEATARLTAADARWGEMRVLAATPASIGDARAYFADNTTIWLDLPRGEVGPKGLQGAAGPSDINLAFADGVLTITPK